MLCFSELVVWQQNTKYFLKKYCLIKVVQNENHLWFYSRYFYFTSKGDTTRLQRKQTTLLIFRWNSLCYTFNDCHLHTHEVCNVWRKDMMKRETLRRNQIWRSWKMNWEGRGCLLKKIDVVNPMGNMLYRVTPRSVL